MGTHEPCRPGVECACVETCRLPGAVEERPSPRWLAALRALGRDGFHVHSCYGAVLHASLATMLFSAYRFHAATWNGAAGSAYRGPCSGLRAVFRSRAVGDRNPTSGADLWELRYATPADAARVAAFVGRWDWGKHPIAHLVDGRSLFVVEGRHREPRVPGRLIERLRAVRP